jgi:hypothetical protein
LNGRFGDPVQLTTCRLQADVVDRLDLVAIALGLSILWLSAVWRCSFDGPLLQISRGWGA